MFIGLLYYVISHVVHNAQVNSSQIGVGLGFDFLWREAGFVINQTPIAYNLTDSNLKVLWIGVINTIIISLIGIVLMMLLSFSLAILQTSGNLLLVKCIRAYVNIVRNVPVLLQILLVYNLFINELPVVRKSINWHSIYVNNRGLFIPKMRVHFYGLLLLTLAAGLASVLSTKFRTKKIGLKKSFSFPIFIVGFIILFTLAEVLSGFPIEIISVPKLGRFNLVGGWQIYPEFVALLLALVLYVTSYNVEIVRAGFESIPKGQYEAAKALGLSWWQRYQYIIVPQAMALVIPPLISQCLNLTKGSALGVAIGYPEVLLLFVGIVLMQTGKSIEIICITMLVYLSMSLFTSIILNLYYWYALRWEKR